MMGSSPAKGVKVKPREGGKAPYSKDKSGPKAEANYSDEATAEDLSRQSLKQKYMRKQLFHFFHVVHFCITSFEFSNYVHTSPVHCCVLTFGYTVYSVG